MCSGPKDALDAVSAPLLCMSGGAEKIYVMSTSHVGVGVSAKMLNQVLCGVHAVATGESLAFAKVLELDCKKVYEDIQNTDGSSWIFSDRGKHIVNNDWTPYSVTDLFVKDLGIVVTESRLLNFPAVCSAICWQLYIATSRAGYSRQHDASIVRIWEMLQGIRPWEK